MSGCEKVLSESEAQVTDEEIQAEPSATQQEHIDRVLKQAS